MKIKAIIILLLITGSQIHCHTQDNTFDPIIIVNQDEQDESLLSTSKLEFDLGQFKKANYNTGGDPSMHLNDIPFPVVEYNAGSAGTGPVNIRSYVQITGSYFLVGKHPSYNTVKFQGSDTHKSFCNILVLTDTLDNVKYTHTNSYISSRNHPDYIGSGYVKTRDLKIDYTVFHMSDTHAYALIGYKIFDLQLGETIMIAPQKNNSLKFLQIKSPYLGMDMVSDYWKFLVNDDTVEQFLTDPENIGTE